MFHYKNQPDQGDEKDGLEIEGLEGEIWGGRFKTNLRNI